MGLAKKLNVLGRKAVRTEKFVKMADVKPVRPIWSAAKIKSVNLVSASLGVQIKTPVKTARSVKITSAAIVQMTESAEPARSARAAPA